MKNSITVKIEKVPNFNVLFRVFTIFRKLYRFHKTSFSYTFALLTCHIIIDIISHNSGITTHETANIRRFSLFSASVSIRIYTCVYVKCYVFLFYRFFMFLIPMPLFLSCIMYSLKTQEITGCPLKVA